MEIVGWLTVILLCALALTFIIIELGPVIHSEVCSWKIRKQKSIEAKQDKSQFKKEMKDLKRMAKKIKYMKKHNIEGMDNSSTTDDTQCDVEEDVSVQVEDYVEDTSIEEDNTHNCDVSDTTSVAIDDTTDGEKDSEN